MLVPPVESISKTPYSLPKQVKSRCRRLGKSVPVVEVDIEEVLNNKPNLTVDIFC